MARTLTGTALSDRQNRFVLAGAIGLALAAAIFAFAALRSADSGEGGSSVGITREVVVATRAIDAGEIINADMVSVASLSEDAVIESSFGTTEQVVGQVARSAIAEGEQFTPIRVGQNDGSGGVAGVIPRGMRGVTVGVTEEKVFGGLLAPGDHVDIIAIVPQLVDEVEVPTAVVLVQNAEVVAVADQQLKPITTLDNAGNPIESDTADGSIAVREENVDAQPEARNVTLAVTPADASIVALAQEEWSVWLSLRGPGDNDIPAIGPRTVEFD